MKKSQLRKIIRESIKQLMTEQQTGSCSNVTGKICAPGAPNDGAQYANSCLTIDGALAQVGDVFWSGTNSTSGGANIPMNVTVSSATPNTGNAENRPSATCEGGSGCTLSDFENAAAPYAGGYAPGWIQMFFNKFDNHPNGCNFLNSRLQIQQNKLNQLQQAGTNPAWQNKLQLKIQAIQAMIAQCCS